MIIKMVVIEHEFVDNELVTTCAKTYVWIYIYNKF